jgi:hypothetical protein
MRNNVAAHPSEDVLENYALGHLNEEPTRSMEEHLLVCTKCQNALADVDAFIAGVKEACLDAAAAAPYHPGRLRFFSQHRLLWAVAVASALLVIAVPISRRHLTTRGDADVALRVSRGAGVADIARAPSGRVLRLHIDLSELPRLDSYSIEIVNAEGARVWYGLATPSAAGLVVAVTNPPARGSYWVRLYGAPSDLLREYGLKIG